MNLYIFSGDSSYGQIDLILVQAYTKEKAQKLAYDYWYDQETGTVELNEDGKPFTNRDKPSTKGIEALRETERTLEESRHFFKPVDIERWEKMISNLKNRIPEEDSWHYPHFPLNGMANFAEEKVLGTVEVIW